MKKSNLFAGALSLLVVMGTSIPIVSADQTKLSPYSWDAGLYATTSPNGDAVHAWGRRNTNGAWGTGPVNYQSGATVGTPSGSQGSVGFTMSGTYCPGGVCGYGSGSGYKSIVQFWNDPNNYIAFGLIHDPGVSSTGTTLMVEGSANGHPVGGYWSNNAITGANHSIRANWNGAAVTFIMDGTIQLSYPVATTKPSISFLAAGRDTGDIPDATFTNINFDPGSVVSYNNPTDPGGTPYLTYGATVKDGGSGSGHSAYINAHDASGNAISIGVQTDYGAPESQGTPYFVWERVQNGQFDYGYVKPASSNPEAVTLKWWKSTKIAGFYNGNTMIASIPMNLQPRLFFNAEGNARLNGDSVNSMVTNVQVAVGDQCPTYCGLNGVWNTSSFNFHGLTASNTNGQPQNGANFAVNGTVNGLASGHNWDTDLVAGIGMIAQYWNGQ